MIQTWRCQMVIHGLFKEDQKTEPTFFFCYFRVECWMLSAPQVMQEGWWSHKMSLFSLLTGFGVVAGWGWKSPTGNNVRGIVIGSCPSPSTLICRNVKENTFFKCGFSFYFSIVLMGHFWWLKAKWLDMTSIFWETLSSTLDWPYFCKDSCGKMSRVGHFPPSKKSILGGFWPWWRCR